MSARSTRTIVILAIAAATVAFPTAALAGSPDDSLSAVDSIAADASTDGTTDSTSDDVSSEASDSATTDTYGGSTDSVPPVTCDSSSSSDSDSSTSDSSSSEDCGTTDTETPTTETPTEETCTDDATIGSGTVCGGGGIEEAGNIPKVAEPVVDGGGEPVSEPVNGGGATLPFTGLPLWYAIYGGIGLVLLGVAVWIRARFLREH